MRAVDASAPGAGGGALPAERAAQAALTAPGAMFEIRDEDVHGVELPVFRRRLRSLGELLDHGLRFGDRTFVADGAERLSFAEHHRRASALAHALQTRYGVRAGDRVALFAANRWDWLVSFWAVVAAGAVPCAMNGWWTADEFGHAADLVDPVLVIGDRPRLERLDRLAPRGLELPLISLDEDLPELLRAHRGAVPQPVGTPEDEPALLQFTSGTTGRPKAVALSHRSAIGFLQVNVFQEAVGRVCRGMPLPAADGELPPSDDVVLVTAPLFHASMLQGMALLSAMRGSRLVLIRGRFDPERVIRTIAEERVTTWGALGSAAPRVAASPALHRYDTGSLQRVGVGGAPVSPAVQQRLRSAFPGALGLSMGYTSTEGGAVIARINGPDYLAHPTSTGRITPTVQVELRDETGRPVPAGGYGEVHVRSAYTMLGYWKDPESTASVLKDGGWLAMGDIARFDEDGRLYIDTRARDLILVSAENVSPTEVEYVLDEHPEVSEVAVLAVDDAVTGDAVCAVVLPEPGSSPSTERLAAWCRSRLAHYKVPTRWLLVEEPLPRNPGGKVLKRALRERVDKGGGVGG
jgi:acyl-CoA synthetase (AMP-forming)/AMP-acid ligase II